MTETGTATIIGAGIAAFSGLIGAMTTAFLGGWRQERLEANKRKWAIEDARSKRLEDTIIQLTIKLSAALHSMCWIAWVAMESPDRLDQGMADFYDKDMHILLPDIMGLSAIIGSIDASIYSKAEPIIRSIFKMDADTGRACMFIANEHDKAVESLRLLYMEFLDADKKLPKTMANIISEASQTYMGAKTKPIPWWARRPQN